MPECTTRTPRRTSPSITLETFISLPGMGCDERITVSCWSSLSHLLSAEAMRASADMGSPWEPVEITHTRPGSSSRTSSMSSRLRSGMVSRPISRASFTFFFMDRPRVAITRSWAMAASAICWTRWTWLAKQAVTMRRPALAANRSWSTLPTDRSDREWPHWSALVESDRRRRTPSFWAMAPMTPRSVSRPSTGVRSSFQSPVWRMVPCGVWNAVAKPWGTECVTGMNSQSNGPNRRRSLSFTTIMRVRPMRPASSMRLEAKPRLRADPMIGNERSRSR